MNTAQAKAHLAFPCLQEPSRRSYYDDVTSAVPIPRERIQIYINIANREFSEMHVMTIQVHIHVHLHLTKKFQRFQNF